jgi:hypothetical protein
VVVGVAVEDGEPSVLISTFLATSAEGDRLSLEPYRVAAEMARGPQAGASAEAAAAVAEGRGRQDRLAAKGLQNIMPSAGRGALQAGRRRAARQSCRLDHRPPRIQSFLAGACACRRRTRRARRASVRPQSVPFRTRRARREVSSRSRGECARPLDGGDRRTPAASGCDRGQALAERAEARLLYPLGSRLRRHANAVKRCSRAMRSILRNEHDLADILTRLDVGMGVAGLREREGLVDVRPHPTLVDAGEQHTHPLPDLAGLVP